MLLLQNAAFLPLYRGGHVDTGLHIDAVEPLAPEAKGEQAIGEIFSDISKDRLMASRKILAYLKDNPNPASFAARFREAGDEDGARVQEVVGREEIAHARFGARWFAELHGALTFDAWRGALPPPLSPMVMRGRPLQREARLRAGFPSAFLEQLDAWQPVLPWS